MLIPSIPDAWNKFIMKKNVIQSTDETSKTNVLIYSIIYCIILSSFRGKGRGMPLVPTPVGHSHFPWFLFAIQTLLPQNFGFRKKNQWSVLKVTFKKSLGGGGTCIFSANILFIYSLRGKTGNLHDLCTFLHMPHLMLLILGRGYIFFITRKFDNGRCLCFNNIFYSCCLKVWDVLNERFHNTICFI